MDKSLKEFNFMKFRGFIAQKKYYYVLKEDDIQMAVDMVEEACDNKIDSVIPVSGDGDFVQAVKAIQKRGKEVENFQ